MTKLNIGDKFYALNSIVMIERIEDFVSKTNIRIVLEYKVTFSNGDYNFIECETYQKMAQALRGTNSAFSLVSLKKNDYLIYSDLVPGYDRWYRTQEEKDRDAANSWDDDWD